MTTTMATPDGAWRVEVVRYLGGGSSFRVTCADGTLASCGATARSKDRGYCATVAQVAALLGDAFAALRPV